MKNEPNYQTKQVEYNDWHPETRSLLRALKAAGCEIISSDNGEEPVEPYTTENAAIECLTACDEGWLKVRCPNGKTSSLWLVYGNGTGELVADYHCNETIDQVTASESQKWEGQKQPTKWRTERDWSRD